MPKNFFTYIAIIVFVTIGLYTITHVVGTLDSLYFQQHKTELTSSQREVMPDNSVVTNYYYEKTPFFYFGRVTSIASLVFPVILVLVLSARLLKQNYAKGKLYFFSLLLPIVYSAINIIWFLIFTDPALGWEYSVGLQLVLMEVIIVFIIAAVANLVILKKKTAAVDSSKI